MALTKINALVNMTNGSATLINHEREGTYSPVAYSVICNNTNVPWCNSRVDFDNGHYLELQFTHPTSRRAVKYAIWQEAKPGQGDYVRFVHVEDSATPLEYSRTARSLGCEYNGNPHQVTDSNNVLVVDGRGWVILYKID